MLFIIKYCIVHTTDNRMYTPTTNSVESVGFLPERLRTRVIIHFIPPEEWYTSRTRMFKNEIIVFIELHV